MVAIPSQRKFPQAKAALDGTYAKLHWGSIPEMSSIFHFFAYINSASLKDLAKRFPASNRYIGLALESLVILSIWDKLVSAEYSLSGLFPMMLCILSCVLMVRYILALKLFSIDGTVQCTVIIIIRDFLKVVNTLNTCGYILWTVCLRCYLLSSLFFVLYFVL